MTETNQTKSKAKPKLSDVRFQEVTYAPFVDCDGRWEHQEQGGVAGDVQVQECSWRLRAEPFGVDPREFKRMARQHALDYPDHQVSVTRRTISYYRLPVSDPVETEAGGGGDDA